MGQTVAAEEACTGAAKPDVEAMNAVEEGTYLQLDFTKLRKVGQSAEAVLPVVVQDEATREVLLVGYANAEALAQTLKTRQATFWSTSRNELWIKGATSGDTLELIDLRVNCEQNSVLYLVRKKGTGVCHTRDAQGQTRATCYYRSWLQGDELRFRD